MPTSIRERTLPAVALVLAVGCGQTDDRNVAPTDRHPDEAAGTTELEVSAVEEPADVSQDEKPAEAVPDDERASIQTTPAGPEAQQEQTASDEATPPSALRSLQLTRRAGIFLCIDDGQFLTAQIASGADGVLELSGQVHRGWDEPALTGCDGSACQRLEEIGPLQLGAAQLNLLEQLTEQLPEGGCSDEASVSCDPCLVSSLTVNDVSFRGDPCTLGCSGSVAVVLEIGDLLDSWVAP